MFIWKQKWPKSIARYYLCDLRVGNDISVTDREESDGHQPHGVEQIGVLFVVVSATHHWLEQVRFGSPLTQDRPFAQPHSPAADYP